MAPRTPEDEAAQLAQQMRDGCLGARLSQVHRIVSRSYEQALRPTGLTLTQLEILARLTLAEEPMRPSELAEALIVERSTMSRNLALMQSRGLIAPAATSATGRTLTVEITPAGTSAAARSSDAWAAAQRDVAAQLGPEAQPILEGWLAPAQEDAR